LKVALSTAVNCAAVWPEVVIASIGHGQIPELDETRRGRELDGNKTGTPWKPHLMATPMDTYGSIPFNPIPKTLAVHQQ